MSALLSALGLNKWVLAVATLCAVLGSIWAFGEYKKHQGKTEITEQFKKADQKGAGDVRKKAERARRDLGNLDRDGILDRLRVTGGLRDD